jgi:Tol biopolymer transport system component
MSGSSRFPFAFRCLLASSIAASSLAAQSTDPRSRVSVGANGVEGNGDSYEAAISSDGRYVAFSSEADNLVAGDQNFAYDVFVHDRTTGATVRVSVDSNGVEGDQNSYEPAISAGGRFVAFTSVADNLVAADHNGAADVFVHDRDPTATGSSTRATASRRASASRPAPARATARASRPRSPRTGASSRS